MRTLKTLVLFSVAVFSLNAGATPIVVDFEGIVPPGSEVIPAAPYIENGFLVNNSSTSPSDGIFSSSSPTNTNGSDIFGWCGGCDPNQVISISQIDGLLFSLLSFDYALLVLPSLPQRVSVVGLHSGGGTIVAELDFSQSWNTHNFVGFNNLSKLELRLSVLEGPDVAIDNLVFATVPNPTTSLLLALGICMGFIAQPIKLKRSALLKFCLQCTRIYKISLEEIGSIRANSSQRNGNCQVSP
jgi:hypothetical protein